MIAPCPCGRPKGYARACAVCRAKRRNAKRAERAMVERIERKFQAIEGR
jgi:hypothetical protein